MLISKKIKKKTVWRKNLFIRFPFLLFHYVNEMTSKDFLAIKRVMSEEIFRLCLLVEIHIQPSGVKINIISSLLSSLIIFQCTRLGTTFFLALFFRNITYTRLLKLILNGWTVKMVLCCCCIIILLLLKHVQYRNPSFKFLIIKHLH